MVVDLVPKVKPSQAPMKKNSFDSQCSFLLLKILLETHCKIH